MNNLTFYIDDEVVYEHDENISLEQQQLDFLDSMDADMKKGIKIRGELTIDPDLQQRSTFVVMNLIKALQQENDAVISVSCAYLISRHPELTAVHINNNDDTMSVVLVNN